MDVKLSDVFFQIKYDWAAAINWVPRTNYPKRGQRLVYNLFSKSHPVEFIRDRSVSYLQGDSIKRVLFLHFEHQHTQLELWKGLKETLKGQTNTPASDSITIGWANVVVYGWSGCAKRGIIMILFWRIYLYLKFSQHIKLRQFINFVNLAL